MDNSMNIYQRLALITSELRTVAKNLTVETGRGKGYKAVSERDVIDAVKPLEEKYGVYSYPCDRVVLESQTLESVSEYKDRDGNVNTTTKTSFFSRIQTTYRFVNVDDPAQFVDTVTFAEGIDSQDKGSGKAMTYCDKYALMKAYKISTGDDPDQTASEETHYTRKDHQYDSAKPGSRIPPESDEPVYCDSCGKRFADYWDGEKLIKAVELAERSKKMNGTALCPACAKKR